MQGQPEHQGRLEGEDRRRRRRASAAPTSSRRASTSSRARTATGRTSRSRGRSARSLVDLMTPKGKRGWGNSVVIGIVTNNNDPDKLGRVRVKYPALGDDTEGWWARIAAPRRGRRRGLLMMPQVGDEVVIGFEHDDVHQPVRARLALERHSEARRRPRRPRRLVLAAVRPEDQIHAKDKVIVDQRQGLSSSRRSGDMTINDGRQDQAERARASGRSRA